MRHCLDTPPSAGLLVPSRATTGENGSYRIGDLYAPVRVEFVDCRPRGNSLATEWYKDAADYESATVVPIAVGSDAAGIDAQLERR